MSVFTDIVRTVGVGGNGNDPLKNAAVILLTYNRDQIIFLRNTPSGKYSVPGGKINTGELPLNAMVREFTEEVGDSFPPITITPADYLDYNGHTRIYYGILPHTSEYKITFRDNNQKPRRGGNEKSSMRFLNIHDIIYTMRDDQFEKKTRQSTLATLEKMNGEHMI